MSFCTQCGHENLSDQKFCSNCGVANVIEPAASGETEISEEPTIQPVQAESSTAKKPLSKNARYGLIGGAVALVAIIAVSIASNSLSIDPAKIKNQLMSAQDFSFGMSENTENTPIKDRDDILFTSNDGACEAETTLHTLVDDSKTLATIAYDNHGGANQWATEDVLEFESSAQVSQFMAAVREGYADINCAYDSGSVDSTFYIEYNSLSSAGNVVGLGGSDSVAFVKHWCVDYPSLDLKIDTVTTQLVIPAGKHVLVLSGTVDTLEDISIDEMNDALTSITKKAFGK